MTGYRYKSVKNLNKSVKVRGYLLAFLATLETPIIGISGAPIIGGDIVYMKKIYPSAIKADLAVDDT